MKRSILFLFLGFVAFSIIGCTSSKDLGVSPTLDEDKTSTIPTCLPSKYEGWISSGGEEVNLNLPDNEDVNIRIASPEKAAIDEVDLLPGQYYLVTTISFWDQKRDNLLKVFERGDLLLYEGDDRILFRDDGTGWSDRFVYTVCQEVIWYAPLPRMKTPDEKYFPPLNQPPSGDWNL